MKKYEDGESFEDSKGGGNKKQDKFWTHFLKEDIARKIYSFHEKGEHFTVDVLYKFCKEELEFGGGRTTFYLILKSMGYMYKKADSRRILSEKTHIQALKCTFLRKYLQFQKSSDKINFIFLDETWIYQNGSQLRQWVHDTDMKGNPGKIKNEGKRFTILHAGCSSGFLNGCSLILDNKIQHRDYHKNMNGEIFKKWVEDQLLPALNAMDGKCVVVMDNAPYHSMLVDKPPNSNSRKSHMEEWLTKNGITFNKKHTRNDLWNIINPILANQNYKKTYVIDNLLHTYGHVVLRLPPYHCQYNPIEMVWGFAKNYYNKNINLQPPSKDKVANLWKEALSKFTGEMWHKSIQHCEKLIKDDWVKYMGHCSVDDIPPIIISLAESDTESEFEFSSDSDSSDENVMPDDVDDSME